VASTVEPVGILDLLDMVRRFLARALMSEGDRRLLDALREPAAAIGEPLLSSLDKGDFFNRLDEVVETPILPRLNLELLKSQALEQVPLVPPSPSRSNWPRELFGGATSRLDAAERLFFEFAAAHRQFMASLPEPVRAQAIDCTEAMAERPLGFLEEPTIHPKMKEIMLEGLRADACLMTLLHALIVHRRPEPWLSLALADTVYGGSYHRLRLLASAPGVTVSEDIVPPSDRLDVALLEQEAKTTEAWLREFASGASNDDAYPFARSDD
jgi:hypothetical protein